MKRKEVRMKREQAKGKEIDNREIKRSKTRFARGRKRGQKSLIMMRFVSFVYLLISLSLYIYLHTHNFRFCLVVVFLFCLSFSPLLPSRSHVRCLHSLALCISLLLSPAVSFITSLSLYIYIYVPVSIPRSSKPRFLNPVF